jgi:paraquat-inducible protein B
MKTKFSPTLIGGFVLGGFVLVLVALFSFGSVNFFSKPQRFVVYFDESIHGLDLGSPVKLRGVRVGRVVDLNVRYNPRTNDSLIAVVCELNRNMLADERGLPLDISSRAQLQTLIDQGLRAQLGVLGLATGLLFVELNFVDPKSYPADNSKTEVRYAVVPAIPSTISEFQASLTEILSNVKRVDFPALANDLRALLGDTRKQVNSLNLTELGSQWTRAGQSVTALAESAEIRQTFVDLRRAINQLTVTLENIDSQVDPAGDKLGEVLVQAQATLKTFNDAALQARNFISAQGGLGDETTRALMQLSEAALAVQRLAEFIERNPNALISGKKAK